jgi:hypothetical protein
MHSVSKKMLFPMLVISFVIAGCGKKSTEEQSGSIGTNSSAQYNTGNINFNSFPSFPCTGSVYNSGNVQTFYCSNIYSVALQFGGPPEFWSDQILMPKAGDIVQFSPNESNLMFKIQKADGSVVGPTALTAPQTITMDQNATISFGKSRNDGTIKVRNITIRRTF